MDIVRKFLRCTDEMIKRGSSSRRTVRSHERTNDAFVVAIVVTKEKKEDNYFPNELPSVLISGEVLRSYSIPFQRIIEKQEIPRFS